MINNVPRPLTIPGRTAEEAMSDPAVLVKEGSGTTNFQMTDSATDRVLGYTRTGLESGQHGAIVSAIGGAPLMFADGSISQGDRLAVSGSGGGKQGYVKASEDVTETFVGYALQDANDGEEVRVLYQAGLTGPIRELTTTPGSEADQVANAFDIGLSQNLAHDDRWKVQALSDDGTAATDIHFSLQDGNGTMHTGTPENGVAEFTLHTDGTETLRALDNSGAINGDVHFEYEPVNGEGVAHSETLTYST